MSALVVAQPRLYRVETPFPAILQAIRDLADRLEIVNWDEAFRQMFAIVVPQASRSTLLSHGINKTAPQDQKLKLFINNVTPGDTDTASTYTEMSTQAYAFIAITGSTWTVTSGTPSHADYAQQTWTFDGTGGTTAVYGYDFVETTSGLLLWSERFSDGPYSIVNNGDQIKITPKLNGSQA